MMKIKLEELETMKYNITCVYKIENNWNGKVYIGSTDNLKSRIKNHIKKLNENKHHNPELQYSWSSNKNNFTFEIVELIEDITFLPYAELYYIEKYRRFKGVYNTNNPLKEYNIINTRIEKKSGNVKKSDVPKEKKKTIHQQFTDFMNTYCNVLVKSINENINNKKKVLPYIKLHDKLYESIKKFDPDSIFLDELEKYLKKFLRSELKLSISTFISDYINKDLLNKYNITPDEKGIICCKEMTEEIYNRN